MTGIDVSWIFSLRVYGLGLGELEELSVLDDRALFHPARGTPSPSGTTLKRPIWRI
jgi:hypothetical protein